MSDFGQPVRLPESRVRKPKQPPRSIGEMLIGEDGWAVPWIMHVTEERECFLDPTYRVKHEPGGTVQMYVKRIEGGFEVTLPLDAKYAPQGACPPGYIPVVVLR